MKYSGKRVLVTGASGFIGSHLTEELVRYGASVRALLHYSSRGDEGNLKHLASEIRREIEVVQGDLTDSHSVIKATRDVSYVFHLGALIAIPYSYVHPFSFVQTNVLGTANILNACLDVGAERIIITSTSEVYGTAVSCPMDEDHRLHPQSPYAASKASADHLAASYARSFNLPVVTVRPFNTFGPRQSMRAVIPNIVVQALTKRSVVIGSTWPTRDFNFVKDIVRGFMLAGLAESVVDEVFNLGSGEEHSVAEVISIISNVVGTPLVVRETNERLRPVSSEVGRLVADSGKAQQLLGWLPQYTFREALEETIEWYAQHEQTISHVATL